jgi:hypothetical protein
VSHHLPGCAADTYPGPGICFCDQRAEFAARHRLPQADADSIQEEALRLGVDADQLAATDWLQR